MRTRILIADDHEVVRAGVRGMLAAEPDWEVCAEAEDGRRALALAVVLKPDLVVVDVAMPGLNGIDVTRTPAAPAAENRSARPDDASGKDPGDGARWTQERSATCSSPIRSTCS